MSCQIVNNGTSISLISGNGKEIILKNQISGIIIVGYDKIRIDTSANAKSYLIDYKEVDDPIRNTIVDLAKLLHEWCSGKK
jgi:hypothetical protein